MGLPCTRCESTGFLNLNQVPDDVLKRFDEYGDPQIILDWISQNESDVQVCDCCGDGSGWYGEPGEHNPNDYGHHGPYAYNGGLPECW